MVPIPLFRVRGAVARALASGDAAASQEAAPAACVGPRLSTTV